MRSPVLGSSKPAQSTMTVPDGYVERPGNAGREEALPTLCSKIRGGSERQVPSGLSFLRQCLQTYISGTTFLGLRFGFCIWGRNAFDMIPHLICIRGAHGRLDLIPSERRVHSL